MSLQQLIDKAKGIGESQSQDRLDLLLSDKTKETQSVYRSQIQKFICWRKKPTYNKWDLLEFWNYLRKKNYSSSYIKGTSFALRILFEAKGWLWEAKLPKLRDTKVTKPPISKEDVIKMIRITNFRGTAEEKIYLALSSIYGLRRAEMASLTLDDLDFNKNTILVHTKKGGIPRKHLIPSPILTILHNDYLGRAPSSISLLFKRLCNLAEIKVGKGIGFHSIRHRLDIELVDAGVPQIAVRKFLRWYQKGDMVDYYYTKEQKEIDESVFIVHPFLKIYQEV